jgi:hypothetical protein
MTEKISHGNPTDDTQQHWSQTDVGLGKTFTGLPGLAAGVIVDHFGYSATFLSLGASGSR